MDLKAVPLIITPVAECICCIYPSLKAGLVSQRIICIMAKIKAKGEKQTIKDINSQMTGPCKKKSIPPRSGEHLLEWTSDIDGGERQTKELYCTWIHFQGETLLASHRTMSPHCSTPSAFHWVSTVPASSYQNLSHEQHSPWKTGKFLWPNNCKQSPASAAEARFVCSQSGLQPALSIFSLTLKRWMEQARYCLHESWTLSRKVLTTLPSMQSKSVIKWCFKCSDHCGFLL